MKFSSITKFGFIIVLLVIVGISLAHSVYAGETLNCANGVCTLSNPLKSSDGKSIDSVAGLILNFMTIVSYLAVILGVLMLMWVGLQFVLAQGKPEEIKKRRVELLWVVIGIGVILGARIIVSAVINTLQATGAVNSTIIQNSQNVVKSL